MLRGFSGDYAQRVDFAVRMQVILEENENAIIIMNDEAHFHLNGTVNKQNLRYWAPENPRNIHNSTLHVSRCDVRLPLLALSGCIFLRKTT